MTDVKYLVVLSILVNNQQEINQSVQSMLKKLDKQNQLKH